MVLAQRNRLVSMLLQDRGALRLLSAPHGFGKTMLAHEYARRMFSADDVRWVNAQSPDFLLGLDGGTLAGVERKLDDQPALVIVDDLPWLHEERAATLARLLDGLLYRGIEVIVTTIPSLDCLRSRLPDRVLIRAGDLLVDETECLGTQIAGHADSAALAQRMWKRAKRTFMGRVPSVCWGNDPDECTAACLRKFFGETLSLGAVRAAMGMLLLGHGTMGDLERIGAKIADDEASMLLRDYPFLGLGAGQLEFDTGRCDVEVLRGAVTGNEVVAQVCTGTVPLAERVLGVLLERGDMHRSASVLDAFCPDEHCAAWLDDRGFELLDHGEVELVETLLTRCPDPVLPDGSSLEALRAWTCGLEGDPLEAQHFARRVLRRPGSTRDDELAARLALIAFDDGTAALPGITGASQVARKEATPRLPPSRTEGATASTTLSRTQLSHAQGTPGSIPPICAGDAPGSIPPICTGGATASTALSPAQHSPAQSSTAEVTSEPAPPTCEGITTPQDFLAAVVDMCTEVELARALCADGSPRLDMLEEQRGPATERRTEQIADLFTQHHERMHDTLAYRIALHLLQHIDSPELRRLVQELGCDIVVGLRRRGLSRHSEALIVRDLWRDGYFGVSGPTSSRRDAQLLEDATEKLGCLAAQRGRGPADIPWESDAHRPRQPGSRARKGQKALFAVDTPADDNAELLHVRLFGGFDATLGDRGLGDKALRRKSRLMLVILTVNQGRDVSRDMLLEELWGDLPRPRALDNFYTIWSNLTSGVGPGPYFERTGDFCRVNARYVTSDVDEFEQISRQILTTSSDTVGILDLYARIEALYRGDLVPSETGIHFIDSQRERYKGMFVDSMVQAAACALSNNDARLALWFARKAKDADRRREDVYNMLIRAEMASGQRCSAIQTYLECQQFLRDELGLDPCCETRDLYDRLISVDPGLMALTPESFGM